MSLVERWVERQGEREQKSKKEAFGIVRSNSHLTSLKSVLWRGNRTAC